MALFSLNLRVGSSWTHPIASRDFPDLNAALAEANASARSLLHKRNPARSDLHGRIDVVNESGQTVARVLLSEALAQMR